MPIDRLTPERRRELTRTALVEAAADIFARRGFHAASLEEIAEAAGFTRGAIYSNFEGKEELLLAVLERYIERQLEAFAGVLERADALSPAERTAAATAMWEQVVHRDRTLLLLSLELRLYALRNPEFRRRLAAMARRQEERVAALLVAEAERQGMRLKIAPEDFAQIASATSEGLQQMAGIDEENPERYEHLAGLFFQLIGDAVLEAPAGRAPAPEPGGARRARRSR